jgi:alpha-D-xyloside xylohydrolase
MTSPPLPHNAPAGHDRLLSLEGWKLENGILRGEIVTGSGGWATATFQALTPSIWRFAFTPGGVKPHTPGPMIALTPGAGVPLRVVEEGDGITVSGPRLSLRLGLKAWSVSFIDRNGQDVWRENPTDIDGLGRPFILPAGFVRRDRSVTCVTESFHIGSDEHLFGLGEKFTPLDKKGQRIVSWTQDAFGSTSERSHKNVPFLWSTRGFGLLIDSTARITWELGTVSCQSGTITAEDDSFEAYILYGPTPAEILRHYADLTGHAPVPPKWTFGLWVSSGGTYRDRPSIEKLVDELEKNDVPADVVHIDPWWMRWRHYCDFRWDETSFPRPQEMIEDIHRRGLKVCLWEHPYISVESDLFGPGAAKGYFVKRPDGDPYVIDYGLSLAPRPDGPVRSPTPENSWNARVAIIDLTDHAAREWFKDLHWPLLRMGVDVFKTDFGEDIPEDAFFSNGETGRTMHNLYPLLYNKAVFEVTGEEKGAGIVWSRSGTAGSQRYPVCWSGDPAADFDSLACTIRGGISAGMSGIPFWSNDIGGYRGTPGEELYIRWAQFGLLCSHSRMHGDSPREPWQFGARALKIVREFIKLRYRLIPYIYSCSHEASETGLPVLRGLPITFPDDPNVYDKDLEFMLGPWFLVAPAFERSDVRNAYIPGGTWFNYWNGTRVEGPRTLRADLPLETIPLFIREGAIIPMAAQSMRVPAGPEGGLTLEVCPGGRSEYAFREDEGITQIRCTALGSHITFEWEGPIERETTVRFNGVTEMIRPRMTLDGRNIGTDLHSPANDGRGLITGIPRSRRGVLEFDR